LSFPNHRGRRPFFLILLLFTLLTCSPIPIRHDADSLLNIWGQEDDQPKNVVILPFDNDTSEKDLEVLVRKSFYNHFSSKNYHDIELGEVDRALKILRHTISRNLREISPVNLGLLFNADFLIYGRVKEFNKIFLGIYSQIAIMVEVEMVDCKSGDFFWGKTILKRSHDGGIPFDLFGIIPAALRSGLHMKKERTVDLIERVSRELVAEIPDPPSPPTLSFFVEIQVASFLSEESARKTLEEFQTKGHNTRIETVTLGDRLWHRVLLGPYYEVSEAEKVRETIEQNSQFQPIFIHHYPDRRDRDRP